jgi:hypothetical protein
MDVERTHQIITQKMQQDGNTIQSAQLNSGAVTLGYQSQFKVLWLLSKIHFMSFVRYTDHADTLSFVTFVDDCSTYAAQQKGQLRGLQVGVCSAPILVANTVDADLIELAKSRPKKDFALFNYPVVVEMSTQTVHTYTGRIIWGTMYSSWIRKRIKNILPF